MENYKEYRKKGTTLLRPYIKGEDMSNVSVSSADKADGHPKEGDMIARAKDNAEDQWLVNQYYFNDNYELVN